MADAMNRFFFISLSFWRLRFDDSRPGGGRRRGIRHGEASSRFARFEADPF
jgi:hypothetical protein